MKEYIQKRINLGKMNEDLTLLVRRIEKRPNMYFINPNVRDLAIFLRGFLAANTVQNESDSMEKNFQSYFSSFVALKLSAPRGESWDKLLKDDPNSWELFFKLFFEFTDELKVRGTMENI